MRLGFQRTSHAFQTIDVLAAEELLLDLYSKYDATHQDPLTLTDYHISSTDYP